MYYKQVYHPFSESHPYMSMYHNVIPGAPLTDSSLCVFFREAFDAGMDEILHAFYDEFQKHTTKYKADVYPFETFPGEFYKMTHVLLVMA